MILILLFYSAIRMEPDNIVPATTLIKVL